jgi:hypothetical protein
MNGDEHEKHHPRQAQAGRIETSSRDSTRHRNPKLFHGLKAAAIEIEEKETNGEGSVSGADQGKSCHQAWTSHSESYSARARRWDGSFERLRRSRDAACMPMTVWEPHKKALGRKATRARRRTS